MDTVFLLILLVIILLLTNGITRVFAIGAFLIIYKLKTNIKGFQSGVLFSNNHGFQVDKAFQIQDLQHPSILAQNSCDCTPLYTCNYHGNIGLPSLSQKEKGYELIDFQNYNTDINSRIAKKNIHTGDQSTTINKGLQKNKVDYFRPFFEEGFNYYESVDWWNNY